MRSCAIGATVCPGTSLDMATAASAHKNNYASVRATMRIIYSEEGIRGLWAGGVPTCMRVGLGCGIYFSCLEACLSALERHEGVVRESLNPQSSFLAGSTARMIAAVITNPISVLKTRFEGERVRRAFAQQSGSRSPLRSRGFVTNLIEIARVEKLRGLVRGLIPTVCRDSPFSGIYFMCYSNIRPALDNGIRETLHLPQVAGTLSSVLAAAGAGVTATMVVHPADVMKTRLQMPGPDRRALALISSILKVEGVPGFFVGVVPRILKRMPQQAITWTCYDLLSQRYRDH